MLSIDYFCICRSYFLTFISYYQTSIVKSYSNYMTNNCKDTILWKYFIRFIFKHVKSKDKLNNVRISICYQLIKYMKTLKVESN